MPRYSVILVKLGGSLITDKAKRERPRPKQIDRLAREIAGCQRRATRLIVSHGSGSFGHAAAAQHGVPTSSVAAKKKVSPEGIAQTQASVHRLHQIVCRSLLLRGARPYSLAPSSWIASSAARVSRVMLDPLLMALDAGLTPLLFGDVVMDAQYRASICSTEEVLLALARRLPRRGVPIKKAIWLGDTDGVYDADGKTMKQITAASWRQLKRDGLVQGHRSGVVDVTGGMQLRIETALAFSRLGIESWIVNGNRAGQIARLVRGQKPSGTCVPATARAPIRAKR